ncbi:asparaginase [Bradyrhizobium neotropicale]|uniref:asparaginase n=1 Tax=Bradyrhizobium neotropicale TaxID=1497615 RepID=UPI001AD64774|nr:asparaginase [Bradyrhizobium neotropicale]MBO4222356.1 asparaginase [Bradyrhizobium neotropicale]
MTRPRILLVSTGGTITMTGGVGGGIAPALTGEDLARAVPELDTIAALDVVTFSTKPGASLTLSDLAEIAALIDARLGGNDAGAVVVQGTDSIEESAFALDLIVKSNKPVVVTGAMRGAASPGADGPANLLAAVTVATAPIMTGCGTTVVLNDEIHAARHVAKADTSLPGAFRSPAAGPLGRVAEGDVWLLFKPERLPPLARVIATTVPPVALVRIGLGDDGRLLSALAGLGYRGAVIEAMGAGHVPASVAPLVGALAEAMPVVLASRTGAGPVFTRTYGFDGSEIDLIRRGVIPSGMLSGVKARLLLQLLLGQGLARDEIASAYAERSEGHRSRREREAV